MFTGIIKDLGTVEKIIDNKTNKTFWIKSNLVSGLHVDESVSHNGVCLTVEQIKNESYQVTSIYETIRKTNIKYVTIGDIINLEQSMQINDRLDGHIVQGHVDGTAECISKKDFDGSIEFVFRFDESNAALIIEKGSVCVNGVSLTAFNVTKNTFTVAIIPYTLEHTNFKNIQQGYIANIEFDVLGKYVNRLYSLKQ